MVLPCLLFLLSRLSWPALLPQVALSRLLTDLHPLMFSFAADCKYPPPLLDYFSSFYFGVNFVVRLWCVFCLGFSEDRLLDDVLETVTVFWGLLSLMKEDDWWPYWPACITFDMLWHFSISLSKNLLLAGEVGRYCIIILRVVLLPGRNFLCRSPLTVFLYLCTRGSSLLVLSISVGVVLDFSSEVGGSLG